MRSGSIAMEVGKHAIDQLDQGLAVAGVTEIRGVGRKWELVKITRNQRSLDSICLHLQDIALSAHATDHLCVDRRPLDGLPGHHVTKDHTARPNVHGGADETLMAIFRLILFLDP